MKSKTKQTNPTLVVELTWDEVVEIAGPDDWLWNNCIGPDGDYGLAPSAVNELYWAIRDFWNDNKEDNS